MLTLRTAIARVCTVATSDGEKKLAQILKENIKGVNKIEVQDTSNGCGSMYAIYVEASCFKGMPKVAQHKMITGLLRNEIKDMHGLSIKTQISQ